MKWSRSKAKSLSLLALFALALQFCLSFGHFHNDLAAAVVSARPSQASTPDTSHDQYVHRDLCAICSTVAMPNTLVDAAPSVLPVPASTSAAEVIPPPTSHTANSRRVAFQSRAPPQS